MDPALRTEKLAHLETRLALYQAQSQLLSLLTDRANSELAALKLEDAPAPAG